MGVACYSAGIVDWTKEELVIMDRTARQIIATNECTHINSSIARLHLSRKKAGRNFIGKEEYVEKKALHA